MRKALQALEYAGFRSLFGLVNALPLETAISLSGAGWARAARFNKRHRRALENLRESLPGLPDAERQRIIGAMWRHLGMTMAEAMRLEEIAADPARLEPTDEARAAIELARKQAVIFVSLHQGNWEAATVTLAKAGVSIAGVYQEIQNPRVEAFVADRRRVFYPGGLYSKGLETVRAVTKHIRAGGSVAILADLRDLRGELVPFFGRNAPSTAFPALLARRFNAPLIAGQVLRTAPGRYRIGARRIEVPETASREADITAATANIQACFETWIRENPEQWMWAHRRWGR